MKKRLTINVNPVDNGYTVNCTCDPHRASGPRLNKNLIAKDEAEVQSQVSEWLAEVFKPEPAQPDAGE